MGAESSEVTRVRTGLSLLCNLTQVISLPALRPRLTEAPSVKSPPKKNTEAWVGGPRPPHQPQPYAVRDARKRRASGSEVIALRLWAPDLSRQGRGL